MMLLETGVLPCFTVPMEAGKILGMRNAVLNNLGVKLVFALFSGPTFHFKWYSDSIYFIQGSFLLIIIFSRLFSCGTSKDGDSFLVEWNESEGTIKRTYVGFRKKSNGVVQFDTTQNHFLAVGEDSQIKFWDMDNNNILTSTDAEGGLLVS